MAFPIQRLTGLLFFLTLPDLQQALLTFKKNVICKVKIYDKITFNSP